MTNRNTKISVRSDDPADAALVTAALNLYFRRLGVMPTLTSERHAELLMLGADEWTVQNNLNRLFAPQADGQPIAAVELADQPPTAMEQIEKLKKALAEGGYGGGQPLCECGEPKEHVGACVPPSPFALESDESPK